MKHILSVFFLCLMLLVSCGKRVNPKPYEYFRIDLPEHSYRSIDSLSRISFDVSSFSRVSQATGESVWGYNIDYPNLNGRIYLTYLPIDIDSFVVVTEDSRRLAYKHSVRASSIVENYYENDSARVYGVMFHIEGNAASPVQFFITDSVRNFLRGSLYFNNIPNYDSILPVANYVEEDIARLIESVRWKKL